MIFRKNAESGNSIEQSIDVSGWDAPTKRIKTENYDVFASSQDAMKLERIWSRLKI